MVAPCFASITPHPKSSCQGAPGYPLPLQLLALYKNSFTGTIPANWALPETLRELDLNDNKLQGSIPAGWKLGSSLQVQEQMD